MSLFVRGSGIEKATAYDLLRKVGNTYEKVWRKTFGKQQPEIMSGYINESGASATSQYAKYSEMIDVTDFDENDNTTQAFTMLSSIMGVSGALLIAFYTKKEDYTSFVYGYTANELTELWGADYTGANLVDLAQQHKANYVVFTVDVNADLWYYTPNKINFRLDEYVNFWNVLPAGQTHYLVVKAIGEGGVDLDGDGIIYSDSDYGGDADGNPLEYTAEVSSNGAWLSELLTGDANAHDEFMAVANHSESLSNVPEYMYYEETIKSLLEGKKITRVACPNLGAGNTVTFYSNPWSTGTLAKEGRTELFTITGGADEATGGSNMTTYYVANPSAVKSGESVAFAASNGVKMVAYDQLSFATPVKYAYNTDTYTSALDKFVNFDFYLEV